MCGCSRGGEKETNSLILGLAKYTTPQLWINHICSCTQWVTAGEVECVKERKERQTDGKLGRKERMSVSSDDSKQLMKVIDSSMSILQRHFYLTCFMLIYRNIWVLRQEVHTDYILCHADLPLFQTPKWLHYSPHGSVLSYTVQCIH